MKILPHWWFFISAALHICYLLNKYPRPKQEAASLGQEVALSLGRKSYRQETKGPNKPIQFNLYFDASNVMYWLCCDLTFHFLHTRDLGLTESWHITLPNLHLKLCKSDGCRDWSGLSNDAGFQPQLPLVERHVCLHCCCSWRSSSALVFFHNWCLFLKTILK